MYGEFVRNMVNNQEEFSYQDTPIEDNVDDLIMKLMDDCVSYSPPDSFFALTGAMYEIYANCYLKIIELEKSVEDRLFDEFLGVVVRQLKKSFEGRKKNNE